MVANNIPQGCSSVLNWRDAEIAADFCNPIYKPFLRRKGKLWRQKSGSKSHAKLDRGLLEKKGKQQ